METGPGPYRSLGQSARDLLLHLEDRLGSSAPVQQEEVSEETFGPLSLKNKVKSLSEGNETVWVH